MRILYNSKLLCYKRPFGVLRQNENCEITIYIPQDCKTRFVKLELFSENGGFYAAFSLNKAENSDKKDYETYSGSFSLSEAGLFFYRFYIITEQGEFPLYKQGEDTNMSSGDYWQISCIPNDFHTPKEFRGKIMYQIFPDRFNRVGSPKIKGKIEPYYIHKTTKELPNFLPDSNGEVLNCDFFGGNLKGIEKKLDYLESLGVSVIYLNPIFKAYSNHRYDTADYKKIDELLGSERDFRNLCKAAHKCGIKIVLDGVFSHTGSKSVYFESAIKDQNSPYRAWYDFKDYPNDYTAWWGIKTLPCVNEMNESFIEYIISGEDSVVEHWLKLGADGFRLDVADELPDEFILKLRQKMKSVNPNALLIGEVWEDASNKISYGKRREYFTGGELDSVMNYPYRNAIIDFVTKKDDGEGFRQTVLTINENYPKEVVACLMNSLSTHDTPRIITVLSGVVPPNTKTERAEFKLSKSQRDAAETRLKTAAFLQFSLAGIASVYYGDEIALEGFEDPFCRGYFDWEKAKTSEMKDYYKALAAMRKRIEDYLNLGDIEFLESGDSFIKFCYHHNQKTLYVSANCSETERELTLNKTADIIFSQNAEIEEDKIILKPQGVVMFE